MPEYEITISIGVLLEVNAIKGVRESAIVRAIEEALSDYPEISISEEIITIAEQETTVKQICSIRKTRS